MREITDETGRRWAVVGLDQMGAHRRMGAMLAFRPADEPDAEPLLTSIQFNSIEAAAFAIGSMGEHELHRRLEWAKTAAGRS